MCGRFTLRTPASVLIAHFQFDVGTDRQLELFGPRYNIAPTQEIVVIRLDAAGGRRQAGPMRWGLVPSWSKQLAAGPPMINARAETLAEKPAFRTAYRRRRCLIPADGFYEWQAAPGGSARGKKQPFYIRRPDAAPFAFAGLWERWTASSSSAGQGAPAGAERPLAIESTTIVTTAANHKLRELNDRMPVILALTDYALWLDPQVEEPAALAHLLSPCGEEEVLLEPVSTRVNRVVNDDPQCIAAERTLFD